MKVFLRIFLALAILAQAPAQGSAEHLTSAARCWLAITGLANYFGYGEMGFDWKDSSLKGMNPELVKTVAWLNTYHRTEFGGIDRMLPQLQKFGNWENHGNVNVQYLTDEVGATYPLLWGTVLVSTPRTVRSPSNFMLRARLRLETKLGLTRIILSFNMPSPRHVEEFASWYAHWMLEMDTRELTRTSFWYETEGARPRTGVIKIQIASATDLESWMERLSAETEPGFFELKQYLLGLFLANDPVFCLDEDFYGNVLEETPAGMPPPIRRHLDQGRQLSNSHKSNYDDDFDYD